MRSSIFSILSVILFFGVQTACAEAIVIGGSSDVSPPPFREDSFWGMTSSIERAFPFTVASGGPYYVEQVEVAVYYYEGSAGSSANYSINLDDSGQPGQSIVSFEMTGITTAQQVLAMQIAQETTLYSDTAYWLVGGTSEGQVNWNFADNVFGTAAYRMDEGEWTILSNTNLSAFAILGSPVPEPSTLFLLSLGALITLLLLGLGVVMVRRKH